MPEPSATDIRTLFDQAMTAVRAGELADAAALFGRATELDPLNAAVHANRGAVLADLGRWSESLASIERALELKPDFALAHCNRGNALRELGRPAEALASYDRALSQNPGLAEAYCNRGNVLRGFHRLDEALASCDRAIELNPRLAAAHCNRGSVLRDLDRWTEALASQDTALDLDPRCADAHCNRGVVLQDLQRLPEALESLDRALAIQPQLAEAHYARATSLLAMGEYAEGWQEYEWRFRLPQTRDALFRPLWPQPRWRGEALAGRTLFLPAEQGMGDALQFCRYAVLAARAGGVVVLQVPQPLVELLRGLTGVGSVIAQGDPTPAFDCWCPLMSLPRVLGTTLETVPAALPYLRAPEEALRRWRACLPASGRRRVGLVWSGGFRPDQPELWSVNARRNIPFVALEPLACQNLEFYSLQKGEPAELEAVAAQAGDWRGPRLIDHMGAVRDFADTAALLDHLDLVIAVDTSTAHLAGALGRPVWLLNRFDSCWRWLHGRSDSPWYPGMRIYRQEAPGDWAGVIRRVRSDLGRFATG